MHIHIEPTPPTRNQRSPYTRPYIQSINPDKTV